ncbi:MAG: helix-turn-helix domain-containing protein [bacterium]
MKKLGRELRQWRARENLSQDEVARVLGISRSYLSMLEQKNILPSVALLEKISQITGIPVGELLQEDDDAYTPTGEMLTSKEAYRWAEELLHRAGLDQKDLPEGLWEFLCRKEAIYLRVSPEEVRILKSLKFKKGDGYPTAEDYQDFLVRVLRPNIPK